MYVSVLSLLGIIASRINDEAVVGVNVSAPVSPLPFLPNILLILPRLIPCMIATSHAPRPIASTVPSRSIIAVSVVLLLCIGPGW